MLNQSDNKTLASLEERLREAAALLLQHAEGLTAETRQFLYDLGRKDGRSRFQSLARLLGVSARCEDPAMRYLVPELCRGAILAAAPAPVLGVPEAFALETAAEGAANVAQVRHLTERSAASAASAVRPLAGHLEALRAALDAAHRERYALRVQPPARYARRDHQPAPVAARRA